MKLPTREFGEPRGIPVVLVAGLFGEGKNLGGVARTLSAHHHVITVDQRNHGSAPWSDEHNYHAMAADIVETLEDYEVIDLMGHSMGGKTAMMTALLHPHFIRRLLIADIAPVAYHHDHHAHIDAMLGLDLSQIANRREADAALERGIPDDGVRAFLLHGLKFDDQPHWQNNLRVLKASMDNIVGWPEISGSFDGPTLFVGGTNSDYMTLEHRDDINRYFTDARITHIKNAGHWLHVEQPAVFAKIISDFFDG